MSSRYPSSKPYGKKPYAPKPYGDKRGSYKPSAGSVPRSLARGPAGSTPRSSGSGTPSSPRTDWNPVAQWYDELVGDQGSEYQQQVVIPGVLRLLGAGPGDRVLDIACGQGVLCRLLHQRQAKPVGVDASLDLLGLARQRSDPSIPFHLGDARHLSAVRELVPESFHAAVCVLAIQDMDPIQPVFDSAAQLLRPGGRLVLAMTHPCFRVPKQSAWGWDPQRSVQFRRVDRYLTCTREPIIANPGKPSSSLHTWSFHRPLQTYIRTLAKSGLFLDALEEWTSHKVSDSGPRAMAENLARKEIPLFLALRAVKVRGFTPTATEPTEPAVG